MNNDGYQNEIERAEQPQTPESGARWQPRQPSGGYEWNAGADDGSNGQYRWSYSSVSSDAAPRERRTGNRGLKVFLIIIAVVAALALGLFAAIGAYRTFVPGGAAPSSAPGQAQSQPEQESTLPPAASLPEIDRQDKPQDTVAEGDRLTPAQIYKKCSPFVVGIVTYMDETDAYTAEGSGVIMSADGYVITNAHVVSGGAAYDVVLPDGSYYEAGLMGYDSQTDIAVLKLVSAESFPYATFGDSDQLEVGEMVTAIGNPDGLNLATSQTVGYVSALGRLIETESTYTMECIQTDAAINPGSSGGPLINEYGQVVGINSAKLADVDYEGIGFSIPINTVMPVARELILNGKVTGRAMLGIMVQEVITPAMSEYYGLPSGLVIAEISSGSGMEGTRAQAGDIVVAIGGEETTSLGVCSKILDTYKPGDTVTVRLYHISNSFSNKGEYYEIEITLSGS